MCVCASILLATAAFSLPATLNKYQSIPNNLAEHPREGHFLATDIFRSCDLNKYQRLHNISCRTPTRRLSRQQNSQTAADAIVSGRRSMPTVMESGGSQQNTTADHGESRAERTGTLPHPHQVCVRLVRRYRGYPYCHCRV